MSKNIENKIIYSINIEDVQYVATEELGRQLRETELANIEQKIGDYFDWYDGILNAIHSDIEK